MGGAGFEPAKAVPSDLQSDPFDRSGNPPGLPRLRTFRKTSVTWKCYSRPFFVANRQHLPASGGTRTHNLLITNQLLCQLSYASSGSHTKTTKYKKRVKIRKVTCRIFSFCIAVPAVQYSPLCLFCSHGDRAKTRLRRWTQPICRRFKAAKCGGGRYQKNSPLSRERIQAVIGIEAGNCIHKVRKPVLYRITHPPARRFSPGLPPNAAYSWPGPQSDGHAPS